METKEHKNPKSTSEKETDYQKHKTIKTKGPTSIVGYFLAEKKWKPDNNGIMSSDRSYLDVPFRKYGCLYNGE